MRNYTNEDDRPTPFQLRDYVTWSGLIWLLVIVAICVLVMI